MYNAVCTARVCISRTGIIISLGDVFAFRILPRVSFVRIITGARVSEVTSIICKSIERPKGSRADFRLAFLPFKLFRIDPLRCKKKKKNLAA